MQFQRTDTGFFVVAAVLDCDGGFLACLFLFNEKKLNSCLGKQRKVPENKGLRKNSVLTYYGCV